MIVSDGSILRSICSAHHLGDISLAALEGQPTKGRGKTFSLGDCANSLGDFMDTLPSLEKETLLGFLDDTAT